MTSRLSRNLLSRTQLLAAGSALAIALAIGMTPSTGFAAAQVSGSSEAVSVDAQDSSIKEILAAISNELHLTIDSAANLEKRVSGSYHGSLRHVVSRLLDGYNYVLKKEGGRLQIVVFGTQPGTNAAPVAGAPAAPVMAANTAPVSAPAPAPLAAQGQPKVPAAAPTATASDATAPAKAGEVPMLTPAENGAAGPVPFQIAEGPSSGPVLTPASPDVAPPTPTPTTTAAPMPLPSTVKPPEPPAGQVATDAPNSLAPTATSAPNAMAPTPTPSQMPPTATPQSK